MRQGLCNGPVSVGLCVCPIHGALQQRAAGLLLADDIDRLLHGRHAAGAVCPAATAPQQHGAQQHGCPQQTRAVSRLQPP